MSRKRRRRAHEVALLGMFFIGLIAALAVALPRHRLETSHRTVDIVADWESWHALAADAGVPPRVALDALQKAGVTRIAVGETRLSHFIDRGLVAMTTYEEAAALPFIDTGSPAWRSVERAASRNASAVFLIWQSGSLTSSHHIELLARLQAAGATPIASGESHIWALVPDTGNTVSDVKRTWRDIGVGYDGATLALMASQDVPVALRPLAGPYMDRAAVDRRVPLTSKPVVYIFDGAAVPGAPHTISAWAETIAARDGHVALVEFATQQGVSGLIRAHRYEALRLHSIVADELHQLSVQRSTARWWRAVSERGIRALYVRPYGRVPNGMLADDLWAFNLDYVSRVTSRLCATGWHLGPAQPFVLPAPTFISYVCIVIGTAAALVWLGRFFVDAPSWLEWSVVGAAVIFALWQRGDMGREMVAFLAAVTMPSLATLWTFRWVRGSDVKVVGWASSVWGAVAALLLASGVSLVGALFVVGLLSATPYALGAALFRGVKAMHIVPPFIVATGLLWDKPLAGWRDVNIQWTKWRRLHVGLVDVAVLAVIGLIGLIVVLRTGNETFPVLSWELQVREWLEHTLGVRPRNKEFLLGHPAFVAGIFLMYRAHRHPVWLAIFGAVAAVGQASLVNTFAHLHSPLGLGLARSGYGLLLGTAIGSAVVAGLTLLTGHPRSSGDGDGP